jgi:hypothetical protein
MQRKAFSTLWGHEEHPATPLESPFTSDAEARKMRDAVYYQMKKQGLNVRRSTNPGQMRQYWSFGHPCGRVCTVYEIYIN